jgi:hypothetical protein
MNSILKSSFAIITISLIAAACTSTAPVTVRSPLTVNDPIADNSVVSHGKLGKIAITEVRKDPDCKMATYEIPGSSLCVAAAANESPVSDHDTTPVPLTYNRPYATFASAK